MTTVFNNDSVELTLEEREGIKAKNDFSKNPYVVVWIDEKKNVRNVAIVPSVKEARRLIGKSKLFWIYDDFEIFERPEKIGCIGDSVSKSISEGKVIPLKIVSFQ